MTALLLLLPALVSHYLECARVLLRQEMVALCVADGLVHLSLRLVVFRFFASTARRVAIDVLGLDYFLEALLASGFLVALTAVELGHLGSRGLLSAFLWAFGVAFV